MATPIERTRAILNALKNNTVSDELGLRIMDAFVNSYINLWPTDPKTGTPIEPTGNQRLLLFLTATRQYIRDIVRAAESSAAAEVARRAALDAVDQEVNLGNA